MRPSQRVKVKKNSKREKGVKHLIRDTKRRLSRDIPQEAREGLETKLKALEAQLAAQVSVVTRDNRRQIWFNGEGRDDMVSFQTEHGRRILSPPPRRRWRRFEDEQKALMWTCRKFKRSRRRKL